MREIDRIKMGFFPARDRIVRAVAGLFKLPFAQQGPLVVLDADELRALRVRHLDTERGGLILDPEWTKNRNPDRTFQPLPHFLAQRLKDDSKDKSPNDSLVFVTRDAAEILELDLERAGLKKWGPGGKVDFHALRVTFFTLVDGAGASPKSAQALPRNSTPDITFRRYVKVVDSELVRIAEAVGQVVAGAY